MLRTVLEGLFLFLVPFAAFGLYLYAKGQNPVEPAVWSKKSLSWLTLIALSICFVALVAWGSTHQSANGTYVPSHVAKDGSFVPGAFAPAAPRP
jgi:Family of unknown function (DUF6111)